MGDLEHIGPHAILALVAEELSLLLHLGVTQEEERPPVDGDPQHE